MGICFAVSDLSLIIIIAIPDARSKCNSTQQHCHSATSFYFIFVLATNAYRRCVRYLCAQRDTRESGEKKTLFSSRLENKYPNECTELESNVTIVVIASQWLLLSSHNRHTAAAAPFATVAFERTLFTAQIWLS